MAQKISPDDVSTCAALGCCTTTLLLTKYYFCPCFCNMSSMGDGLNAGAATYTPHDPTAPAPETRRASQMGDDSMMDEIEAALEMVGNIDDIAQDSCRFSVVTASRDNSVTPNRKGVDARWNIVSLELPEVVAGNTGRPAVVT